MQDFSKFLDDNFDVKDWVNGAFRTQKDSQQQKDVSMQNMVLLLIVCLFACVWVFLNCVSSFKAFH